MPIVPDLVLPGPARFLEARLTDAVLDMANKLIGGLFARARKARERRRYVAGTRNVGRLMRLFHGTIEALGTVNEMTP